jgi:hypothetical protein
MASRIPLGPQGLICRAFAGAQPNWNLDSGLFLWVWARRKALARAVLKA